MKDKCELCQASLSSQNYVARSYRKRDLYICKKCDEMYQTFQSDAAGATEKENAGNYFKSLLLEDKPSDVGDLFIQENIEGEEIDPDELTEEIKSDLSFTDQPSKSSFSGFLRILAWIVWISGLIVSIIGANVPRISSYSYTAYTEFSFSTFLTLFISYFINGVILMGLATVVDKISETRTMMDEVLEKLNKLQK